MRKISADYIFPVSSPVVEDKVIIIGDQNTILAIEPKEKYDPTEIELYNGVIIPGFVNTHCHLELSHMLGKVDTGTELIPFIKNVVERRGASPEIIQEAIQKASDEMYHNGIVAVGDISNVVDTFAQKRSDQLRYYTFVECFDFLQEQQALTEYNKYKAVYDQAPQEEGGNRRSCVPHAPYSVSKRLFELINACNEDQGQLTISIHNQETVPENELFLNGQGDFVDFYGGFGISLDTFEATGQSAIHYALAHMDPKHRTLFVHNTLSTRADIAAAQAWSEQVYWATCPNANLYIENRLPNYQAFIDEGARMTIGTDSLTSNWQLSILEEMKTIAKYQSYVSFEQLITWATLNGAKALGFDQELGSIELGKSCGLNLLSLDHGQLAITDKTTVKRLV
ncbi:MAG: amidohydrolase family protein [Saprospiraceae bacterium]|nr:amidohydrolase family protein [Saprospiraceae bacterium]